MKTPTFLCAAALLITASVRSHAGFIVFEGAGANPAAITPTRDGFRAAVGGGSVAGANGSFGGLRREINWDGVPDPASDPYEFPAGTFIPRGVQFATPGTAFKVSANAGGAAPERFSNPDLQAFTPQKLFAPVGATVADVHFF